jgi:hypothetical protein
MESVGLAGGPIPLQDRQEVAPTRLTSPPRSSRPHSRRSSRASSRRPAIPLITPSITRRASPSSSTPPASTRITTTSLTDEQARQTLETWIVGSEWYRQDEKEPVVGATGVPTCALQLAERGQSIYCCFLIAVNGRGGRILGWKSATDPSSGRDRLHRAIAKERVRRGHRPFRCPRDHDPHWFVHLQYSGRLHSNTLS